MSHLFFDFETEPNVEASNYASLLAEFEEREARQAERENRAIRPVQPALFPQLGRIVAVGCAIDDHEIISMVVDSQVNEVDILHEFISLVYNDKGQKFTSLIGFNCLNFDLPFLRYRAIAHNLTLPFVEAKPWESKVIDLFRLTQGQAGGGLGLKLQCQSWGIEPLLPDVDGSNLPTDPAMRQRYVESDIYLTRELYRMYKQVGLVPK